MTSRATGLHEQHAGTAVRVVAASAATALAVRYRRDLSRSRARLARFDSRTAETSYGPVEYWFGDVRRCSWCTGCGHVLMHREPRARSEIASFLAACGEPVSPEAQ